MSEEPVRRGNFIRAIIERDLESGKVTGVVTRFPPEPNGYLHIGHAKSICINFGFARDYKGRCHLRFDDTNPLKEDIEYMDSIKADVRWLGFDWGEHLYYASDYFERLYEYAVTLIKADKAYVCELDAEQIRQTRGTLTQPGMASQWRNRPIDESLDLFKRMRDGEFEDGKLVLRAKIDMNSPNGNMRDPVIFRIRRATHARTGDAWCIYPMYDYAHCISDAIEGITHSICTLEFEDHRPLYDWFLDQLPVSCHPQQIEFARLNLSYTIMSKRLLMQLVKEKRVSGWDDPRMPTISGLRRRGYTPESVRSFAEAVGLAKADSVVDLSMLESAIREDLETKVPRAMCVHKPLRVVIENYPEEKVENFTLPNYPTEPEKMGYRQVPFCREIFIEQDDFMENPPGKYFRLAPGREVRLRGGYIVMCTGFDKDASGQVTRVRGTLDPTSIGGGPDAGRRVKGTIHWVSVQHCVPVTLRLYDRLFTVPNPGAEASSVQGATFLDYMNPHSLEVLNALAEPAIADSPAGSRFQFERKGYYYADVVDSKPGALVFNRIVTLRDAWARATQQSA